MNIAKIYSIGIQTSKTNICREQNILKILLPEKQANKTSSNKPKKHIYFMYFSSIHIINMINRFTSSFNFNILETSDLRFGKI